MNKPGSDLLHNQQYKQGDTLYQNGDFCAAIKEFEAALETRPNDFDTLWAIGDCYLKLGKADMAEQFYRKALTVCPDNKRDVIIYNIGNSLFDQMKYKEAIEQYKNISKQSSIYKKAKKNINVAQRKIERY